MSPSVLEYGKRVIVWFAAMFSAVETFTASIVSALNHHYLDASAWLLAAVVIFTLAAFGEKIKLFREA